MVGFAQTDSAYIGNYSQDFTIKAFFFENFLSVSTDEGKDIDYIPNSPMNVGVGFSHKKLPFELSVGYNMGVKGNDAYLRTKSFDVQLHKYGQHSVVDVFAKHYQGLYIDDQRLPAEVANCPDISVLQAGLIGQYIVNGKKVSSRAAFSQNEKQLKSAGCMLLGAEFHYFSIDSDSSFVFREENSVRSFQFGANAGYAYNWAIKRHWLASGALAIGANLGNERVKSFFDKNLYLNPTFLSRASVFYNKEYWSLGMSFMVNSASLLYSDAEIELFGGRFYFLYVHRFNRMK